MGMNAYKFVGRGRQITRMFSSDLEARAFAESMRGAKMALSLPNQRVVWRRVPEPVRGLHTPKKEGP